MSGWMQYNKDRLKSKLQVGCFKLINNFNPKLYFPSEACLLPNEEDKVLRPEVWITMHLTDILLNFVYQVCS